MEYLAIIPARGGSKGIPRKNVLPLAGKPLIAYNIEQARLSRFINRILVSTDDPEIADISLQYGSEVVWRPKEISGDEASSESALLHALEHLKQNENYAPDILIFLQCTSPLTIAEDIDGTIQTLLDEDADTATAVVPFHYFLWKVDRNHHATGINHEKSQRLLRQQRDPQYLETGAVYVMRVPGFTEAKTRFFGKTVLYHMPAERRLEIDEPVDLEIAELLLRKRLATQKPDLIPENLKAVIFDFDGVFTDNKAILIQDGQEGVIVNRSDGMAIRHLREAGLSLLILSTESNPVVQARAQKLGIPCLHGINDKWQALKEWLEAREFDPRQIIYVGNDINDLAVMKYVGCAVAVADAYPEVVEIADLVLSRSGGDGAIRELSELILKRIKS